MIKNLSIEKVFLMFAIFFGLIYLVITPPFQSVDENFHFQRAYSISSGKFIAEKHDGGVGSFIPHSITELTQKYAFLIKDIHQKTNLNEFKQNSKIKLDKGNEVFTSFPNTALYSPIPYVAQTLGIKTAENFGLTPLFFVYFGRLFNLVLYCLLGFLTIKTLPALKTTGFLILLTPMCLSLGASLSTDTTVIGVSLLFFAVIMKTIYTEQKIDSKTILLLSFLGAILALSKHNFFLIPLIFLIPKNKWDKNYVLKIAAVLLPAILSTILWSKLIDGLYVNLNSEADMYRQLDFILHNPLNFIGVILATLFIKTFRLIITGIGVLGWQDTRLDFLTYIIYPIMFFLSIFCEKTKHFFAKWQNALIATVVIFSYLIIVTYMYLAWSTIGNPIVIGLNGKYFIPLVLPAMLLIKNLVKKEFCIQNFDKTIYTLSFLILLSSTLSILVRFYDIFPNLYYQV